MGAWGLGIFQSDHGYDTVKFLSDEAGLPNLEAEDGKKNKTIPGSRSARQSEHVKVRVEEVKSKITMIPKVTSPKAADGDNSSVNDSLYAALCTDVERVRKHMDSGVLGKLMSRFRRDMLS